MEYGSECTKVLNLEVGEQAIITLLSLIRLNPMRVSYGGILATIKHVLER